LREWTGEIEEMFKESEDKYIRIHGFAFVKKGSANAKIQEGVQSFHGGEGKRWLRSENFHWRGKG
jgi:hypothetical protein